MKKKICLLLAVVMLFANLTFAAPLKETDPTAIERASVLIELLLGDEALNGALNETVSRSEFVYALGKLFKYSQGSSDWATFDDVPQNHYAANEIYAARQMGFIDAAPSFYPDAPLEASAAIKLAVCFAGYKDLADRKGGYPSGHLQVAMSNDFLDDLGTEFYKNPLTVGSAKILLYNVMLANYVGIDSVTKYSVHYEKYPSNLSVLHDIYIKTGIANASSYTSIMGEKRDWENKTVEIDGVPYKSEDSCEEYLGYSCTAYYSVDGDIRTILAIMRDRNSEYTFDLENFAGIDGGRIKFTDENGKIVSVALDSVNKRMIYNGCGVYFDNSLLYGDGTARIIDNDRDGQVEIVIIDRYSYVKVENISTADGEIGFNDNFGADSLKLDDDVYYSIKSSLGEERTIYDIKVGDFTAVSKSTDGRVVKIILCDNVITGKLSYTDGENNEIGINDVAYKMSASFKSKYFSVLEIGGLYSFVVSPDMRIVAYEKPSQTYLYAYLIAYETKAKGFSQRKVKVFTQNEEMLLLTCHKNIRVNGTKVGENAFISGLGTAYPCPSLVKIKYSEEGELINIDFPAVYTEGTDKETLNEQDNLLRYTFDKTTFRYRSGANSCMPYFNLKGSIIFKIPTQDTDNDEFYEIADSSNLSDNQDYTLDTYDLNDAGSAGVIIRRYNPTSGEFSYHNNTYIIEKVTRGINSDGNDVNRVSCWSLGKFYTYYMDDSVVVKKNSGKPLDGGDIVRLKTNKKGDITAIVVDFDAESGVPVKNPVGTENDVFQKGNQSLSYEFGKLYSVSDGYAYITSNTNAFGDYVYDFAKLKNCYINTKNIIKYNKEDKELRPITLDELKTYVSHGDDNHYAVLRQNTFNINSVYIYE